MPSLIIRECYINKVNPILEPSGPNNYETMCLEIMRLKMEQIEQNSRDYNEWLVISSITAELSRHQAK